MVPCLCGIFLSARPKFFPRFAAGSSSAAANTAAAASPARLALSSGPFAARWDLLSDMSEERDECDGKLQTKCGRMLAAGAATSATLGVNCRRRLIMGSCYLSIHSTRHRLID